MALQLHTSSLEANVLLVELSIEEIGSSDSACEMSGESVEQQQQRAGRLCCVDWLIGPLGTLQCVEENVGQLLLAVV